MAKSTGRGSETTRRRAGSRNSTSRARTGARRGGGKTSQRAAKQPANHAFTGRRSGDRSGVSKLASFLKSSFLRKIAAAGLASAAAALLYKKSDQTTKSNDQGVAEDSTISPIAPALQPTRRKARAKGQAARRADSNTGFASAGGVVSAGPVRKRKKRSDAGTKRARKAGASSSTGSLAGQLVPDLQSTDTSVIALSADAGALDQIVDSPSEPVTEAHP